MTPIAGIVASEWEALLSVICAGRLFFRCVGYDTSQERAVAFGLLAFVATLLGADSSVSSRSSITAAAAVSAMHAVLYPLLCFSIQQFFQHVFNPVVTTPFKSTFLPGRSVRAQAVQPDQFSFSRL